MPNFSPLPNKFALTNAANLKKLFDNNMNTNAHVTYHVPDFQRNFSWDKDKVSQLWQDILETYELFEVQAQRGEKFPGQYLLGSTVLIPDEDNLDVTLIIDGQQRFAVLTILFCIIRDFAIELFANDLQNDITAKNFSTYRGLVGNYKPNTRQLPQSDINFYSRSGWKLKLNDVDASLFNKILDYTVIDNGSTRFLTYDEKEDKIKQELKKSTKSKTNIRKAYNFLYTTIRDGLITNFDESDTAKKKEKKILEDATNEIDTELANDPTLTGVESVFWKNIRLWKSGGFGSVKKIYDGTDGNHAAGEEEKWDTAEEKTALDTLMKKRNEQQQKKNKKDEFDSFESFMDWKIEQYKQGTKQGGSLNRTNFNKARDDLIDKRKTAKTITKRQQNFQKLSQILQHILDNIYVVNIQGRQENNPEPILEDSDAYQIFETINARGEHLTMSNLVKNWILKKIKSNGFVSGQLADPDLDTMLEEQNANWETVFNKNIQEQGDDIFLRESLRSRSPYDSQKISKAGDMGKVTGKSIFKIIKLKVTNADQAIDYIDKLTEDSEFCQLLNSPGTDGDRNSYPTGDERHAILGLHALGAKYIRIPILTAKRKWVPNFGQADNLNPDIKKYRDLVRFLVPFFFRYKTVRDESAQKLETYMIKLCEEIDKNADVADMIKYLLQFDDEHDFEYSLRTSTVNDIDENVAKYMLYEIDRSITSPYSDKKPIKSLQCEHICPQNTDKWKKNNFFKNYAGTRPQQFSKNFIGNIGNLTILRGDINGTIKNAPYPTKRNHLDCNKCQTACTCGKNGKPDGYNSSDLEINKQTVMKDHATGNDLTDWTATIIESRAEYLIDSAKMVWTLPHIRCSDDACKGSTDKNTLEKIRVSTIGLSFDEVKVTKCPVCNEKLELEYPPDW